MNNIKKTAIFLLLVFAVFSACKESDRMIIGSDDTTPPDPPILVDTMLLAGGGLRIYYEVPTGTLNEDLLSIDAEYTAANGDVRRFSASYFKDSLDVLGMTDEQQTVRLYATDRAGNKSTVVPINVKPLESMISQVFNTINAKPGFNSVVINWENKLQQAANVFVNLKYTKQGVSKEATMVFTSSELNDRKIINDLNDIQTVDVTVHVEDRYGNVSGSYNESQLELYQDVLIPKENWALPNVNDTIGGIPMCYGNFSEGNNYEVIDGIIDRYIMYNGMRTNGAGRTGIAAHGNIWNFIIDLGDTYELSRIVTHQIHQLNSTTINPLDYDISIGWYYGAYNVGRYNTYVWVGAGDPRQKPWNEAGWEFVSERTIPNPYGPPATMPINEIVKTAQAGDEAPLYPDNPHYTKPTRWFRYEAIGAFTSNYTATSAQVLSEITLYGKKK
jgi:hypothetical protein